MQELQAKFNKGKKVDNFVKSFETEQNGEQKRKPAGIKKKKVLGLREQWSDKHQILSIQPPTINSEAKSTKKYKIRLCFQDANDKKRYYTIRFGDKNGNDYVDHLNKDKRQQLCLRIRHCDSVLNPNYWRMLLLNNEFPTLQAAWQNYIETHDILKIK